LKHFTMSKDAFDLRHIALCYLQVLLHPRVPGKIDAFECRATYW
jgi:hypothetical protein